MFDDSSEIYDGMDSSMNGTSSDREDEQYSPLEEIPDGEIVNEILQQYQEILAPSDDEENDNEEPVHEFTPKERVEMIQLRAFLNKIHKKVEEKRLDVNKLREEQKSCRQRLKVLEGERNDATKALELAGLEENIAAAYRIQAQINRIDKESFSEKNLDKSIQKDLEAAEGSLTLAQIEEGKYLLAESDLKKKEAAYNIYQHYMAETRQTKEERFAEQTRKLYEMRDENQRKEQELEMMRLRAHKKDIQEAHLKHKVYLKQTMDQIRTQRAEEEKFYREDMDKKIKSVLNLKRDVVNNRENLTALQARDRAALEKKEQELKTLQERVARDGGNANFAVLREKKRELDELRAQQFEALQKHKKVEIAARIVMEEEFMKKKRERLPYLFEEGSSKKNREVIANKLTEWDLSEHERILKNLEKKLVSTAEPTFNPQEFVRREYFGDSSEEEEDRKTAIMDEETRLVADVLDRTAKEGEGLIQPEFQGLWDSKVQSVPANQAAALQRGRIKTEGASKMEQEIMERVLQQTRHNIVQKQVVVGREFNGTPFYSKPEVVHFPDFEVGKVYRKKVILTNISYSVNYCKLTGMSECLKDFITLKFEPSGPLSAGMACELFVEFQPKIYKDLEGDILFLSQIGPFTVPVKCSIKKCIVSVDKTSVNFGVSVIGETLHRHIILANKGAKGTRYEFKLLSLTLTQSPDPFSFLPSPALVDQEEEKAAVTSVHSDSQRELETSSPGDQISSSVLNHTTPSKEELHELDGPFHVGSIGSTGVLEPFSEVKLELIWKPLLPLVTERQFVINFDDQLCEPILIQVSGRSIDVPVWVDRTTVDLDICMYDRLYQDSIVIHNRATTALKIHFELNSSLSQHMEILPKTGYIQAQSNFSAQLKFLPLKSLPQDAGGSFFDKETGLLEVPVIIHVANQTRPVEFTVQAVVTNSDFQFDTKSIDFSYCSIYESVVSTLTLTNKSILPHKYGFVNLPTYVEVQPNDGFGTLLPLESIQLEVIFSPPKAGEYNFKLICKSEINRKFKISCQGVGVHPPLELSHQVIHLPATALNDISTACGNMTDQLFVLNQHTSSNEFTHPVPRIGNGPIVPVGPTTFEFVPPPNCPVHISPTVGTLLPGKRAKISVTYSPTLLVDDIKEEACHCIYRKRQQEALLEYQKLVEQVRSEQLEVDKPQGKGGKKDQNVAKGGGGGGGGAKDPGKKPKPGSPDAKRIQKMESLLKEGPAAVEMPSVDSIVENSDEYVSASVALMRSYPGGFQTVRIPCYVAEGSCPLEPGTLPYKCENTLYLDVHCPTIRPQLVLLSNKGKQAIDFGNICAGQTTQKVITIQNISNETAKLSMLPLDPHGPFAVRNALRSLAPEASHNVLVTFTPKNAHIYQESLNVSTGDTTLRLTLKGQGVTPTLEVKGLDPNASQFYIGTAISGEFSEKSMTLINRSALSIDYSILLDSSAFTQRHLFNQHDQQGLQRNNWIGVQNNNGTAVFDCVPCRGSIKQGESKDITLTFAPDHPSDFYSDGLHILLFDQEESHYFQLKGEAKAHIMYIQGGNQAGVTQEFLGPNNSMTPSIEDPKAIKGTLLYTLRAFMDTAGQIRPAQDKVTFGCVRTLAVSQKKNGEFSFDNAGVIAQFGFTVDPAKGQLEAGTTKQAVITWKPPANHDPNKTLDCVLLVTLRSDVTEQYRILLSGIVVTNEKLLTNV